MERKTAFQLINEAFERNLKSSNAPIAFEKAQKEVGMDHYSGYDSFRKVRERKKGKK